MTKKNITSAPSSSDNSDDSSRARDEIINNFRESIKNAPLELILLATLFSHTNLPLPILYKLIFWPGLYVLLVKEFNYYKKDAENLVEEFLGEFLLDNDDDKSDLSLLDPSNEDLIQPEKEILGHTTEDNIS